MLAIVLTTIAIFAILIVAAPLIAKAREKDVVVQNVVHVEDDVKAAVEYPIYVIRPVDRVGDSRYCLVRETDEWLHDWGTVYTGSYSEVQAEMHRRIRFDREYELRCKYVKEHTERYDMKGNKLD